MIREILMYESLRPPLAMYYIYDPANSTTYLIYESTYSDDIPIPIYSGSRDEQVLDVSVHFDSSFVTMYRTCTYVESQTLLYLKFSTDGEGNGKTAG